MTMMVTELLVTDDVLASSENEKDGRGDGVGVTVLVRVAVAVAVQDADDAFPAGCGGAGMALVMRTGTSYTHVSRLDTFNLRKIRVPIEGPLRRSTASR